MSRVEDLSAELAAPELFRDLCATIASVGKKCVITSKPLAESASQHEESEGLTISALNFPNTMQVWVQLSASNLFVGFSLQNPESIELDANALAHAFQSESSVITMTEVKLRITHKLSRQPSSIDSSASAVPSSHRLVSFHSSDKDIHGQVTKVVEQRIYADFVSAEFVTEEPIIEGIRDYADPTWVQLAQMAKTADQYRHFSDRLRICVYTNGSLVMKSESGDATVTTMWEIDKAERVGASQLAEPEESLFVEEGNQEHAELRAPSDMAACVVAVRDWQTVLQARKLCRRMVLGVLHHRCVVVYGFLKQGRHNSSQDVATFYLWHQD